MNLKYGWSCGALTMLMCWTASAVAITPELMNQTSYQREFERLDINRDGKLTSTETAKDDILKGGFAKADKNNNRSLDEDEFATYKSKVQQEKSKKAASDAAITTKIKSKYLVEKNFKSFKVSVETQDGIVLLSGFVDNEATKKRASEIAASVSGVKSVKNALVVKP
jgi:hyperosmotically inducible periplasmic protein